MNEIFLYISEYEKYQEKEILTYNNDGCYYKTSYKTPTLLQIEIA